MNCNVFLQCKGNELCVDVYHKQSFWMNMLSKLLLLVTCIDTFEVLSDIMAQWYDMLNTFIIAFDFCNAKKMNCALIKYKESLLVFIKKCHHS